MRRSAAYLVALAMAWALLAGCAPDTPTAPIETIEPGCYVSIPTETGFSLDLEFYGPVDSWGNMAFHELGETPCSGPIFGPEHDEGRGLFLGSSKSEAWDKCRALGALHIVDIGVANTPGTWAMPYQGRLWGCDRALPE